MPDIDPKGLKAAREANRRKTCANFWCSNPRQGAYGRYCWACLEERKRTGTMEPPAPKATGMARSISHKRYREFYPAAERLLSRYREAEAVQIACRWLQRWMTDAAHAPTGLESSDRYRHYVPARGWLNRLTAAGAEPLDILTHVLAAWLYGRAKPDVYPSAKDMVQLLGTALLRAVPLNERQGKRQRLTRKAVTEAGTHLLSPHHGLLGWLIRMEEMVKDFETEDTDIQRVSREAPDLLSLALTPGVINAMKRTGLLDALKEGRVRQRPDGTLEVLPKTDTTESTPNQRQEAAGPTVKQGE